MGTMGPESIKEIRFLSALQLSPEGGHAAAVVSKANEENGYDGHIWLVDEGNVRQLTNVGSDRSFLWEDETHILFPAVRTEADRKAKAAGKTFTRYYRLAVDGGEAAEAFSIPLAVTDLKKIDGDLYLAAAYADWSKPDTAAMSEEELAAHKKATKYEKDYQVVDELPFWSNGQGFVNGKRRRLFLYNAATEELKPITGPNFQAGKVRIAGCKKYLSYTGAEMQGIEERMDDLYFYEIETGETRALFRQAYKVHDFVMTKEGILMAASKGERWGMNENPFFYRVDTQTGAVTLLKELDRNIGGAVASDCRLGGGETYTFADGRLWFTGVVGYDANLSTFDPKTGEIAPVTDIAGSVDSFAVQKEKLLCVAMVGQKLQEVYAVEDGKLRQLTSFNAAYEEQYPAIAPDHFAFREQDGYEIDGWVLRPAGYQEGKRYPAIFDIHGGPRATFGAVYYHEMQLWANMGYFVFFCNPRGGDGKGNEFAEVRGAYGTYDYDNLMQFTDEVLRRYPAIDPERVGVTGGSYGGFMTNWIIGHTDRFKAAASQRSISNWVSFTYGCDIGYFFGPDQQAADAWTNVEKLWWHSPLKYADKVKTPTLFIHSDEDYRCWVPEGYQMFTALKLHGVETRMCVFHGENHELSRGGKPEHRIKRLQEITAWFDDRLK